MTDLTAYESALVERVARALWGADNDIGSWRLCADEAIAALTALGLLGPSRTAWLAPWEASEGMRVAGWPHFAALSTTPNGTKEVSAQRYSAMRDAHLKETTS